jgi:hypothetical protein
VPAGPDGEVPAVGFGHVREHDAEQAGEMIDLIRWHAVVRRRHAVDVPLRPTRLLLHRGETQGDLHPLAHRDVALAERCGEQRPRLRAAGQAREVGIVLQLGAVAAGPEPCQLVRVEAVPADVVMDLPSAALDVLPRDGRGQVQVAPLVKLPLLLRGQGHWETPRVAGTEVSDDFTRESHRLHLFRLAGDVLLHREPGDGIFGLELGETKRVQAAVGPRDLERVGGRGLDAAHDGLALVRLDHGQVASRGARAAQGDDSAVLGRVAGAPRVPADHRLTGGGPGGVEVDAQRPVVYG